MYLVFRNQLLVQQNTLEITDTTQKVCVYSIEVFTEYIIDHTT